MVLFETKVMLASLLSAARTSKTFDPIPFSPGFDIAKVTELAINASTHSWEHGTTAQALLEFYNPNVSIFGSQPFPVPTRRRNDTKALEYAAAKIVIGEGSNVLANGDGSAGDPASLGVSAVLLGKTEAKFADAAHRQLEYLDKQAPRAENGAISHRADIVELWYAFHHSQLSADHRPRHHTIGQTSCTWARRSWPITLQMLATNASYVKA